jgi:hypothetical protein
LLANQVKAAAIVKTAKIDKAELGKSWSEYLLAGPTVWDHVRHPLVTEAVRHEIRNALKTDPGGTALVVQFLLNKQSLDPARFDHYHPNLVGPLSKFKTPTTTDIPTTGAQVLTPNTPPTTEPPTTTGPQTLEPVPEPGALLMALGMAGWAWWRRRVR